MSEENATDVEAGDNSNQGTGKLTFIWSVSHPSTLFQKRRLIMTNLWNTTEVVFMLALIIAECVAEEPP